MYQSRRNFLSGLGQDFLDLIVPTASAQTVHNHKLVCISLRGGMDGLNSIIPYGDAEYYAKRPNLSVAPPGNGDKSAINLDGYFGLNPELSSLKRLYTAGNLAIVHATGAPFVTRSHFGALKSMEAAYGTNKRYSDGWLGRYLTLSDNKNPSSFKAIAVNSGISQSLLGTRSATSLRSIGGFDLTTRNNLDFQAVLNVLYTVDNSQIGQQATDTLDALSLLDFYNPSEINTTDGVSYPETAFGRSLEQTAKYIKSGLGTEIYSLVFNGWDHHDDLPNKLPSKLNELGTGLDALYRDLGMHMDETTIIVMTEFGRRVAENASNGTDHGRGGCMLVLGNGVNGGKVYADWPGLADQQLNHGDLEITTDYRTILAELVNKRMSAVSMSDVFPNFNNSNELGIFL